MSYVFCTEYGQGTEGWHCLQDWHYSLRSRKNMNDPRLCLNMCLDGPQLPASLKSSHNHTKIIIIMMMIMIIINCDHNGIILSCSLSPKKNKASQLIYADLCSYVTNSSSNTLNNTVYVRFTETMSAFIQRNYNRLSSIVQEPAFV